MTLTTFAAPASYCKPYSTCIWHVNYEVAILELNLKQSQSSDLTIVILMCVCFCMVIIMCVYVLDLMSNGRSDTAE